ncbi:MAG TPA: peptidylprolyl isomerase [Pyrinomonadaceae bacterium]|jgi:peptidyl-prolyl cis-trans isomerase B (cyclophilin B)|nr:peptidylprolyl isomerase [Pyrinomonadaceae bacterium]
MKFCIRIIGVWGCLFMLAAAAFAQASVPAAQGDTQAQQPNSSNNVEPQPSKKNERPAALTAKPAEPFDGASVEKMAGQCVRLETEAGNIEMEMLPEAAPETVRNFLNLAAIGAFDTTTFSRVVKDFVIQGGSLATRATLPPELAVRATRKIPDEPNYVKHVRGIVSMARPDEPNSASTHFFILVGEGAHLDGKFAAFGRVTRGLGVADAINQASTEGDKPTNPTRVTRAVIFACTKTIKTVDPADNPTSNPAANIQSNPKSKVTP